ncbi:hypothetical protein [Sphingobium aquiterrae]|uniref:hypothetical protein n=1 Tax=Sphingobium aquiterrae TaxID=2038656 RepID=UPI00301A1BBF
MNLLDPLAPTGNEVVEYDRRHLALYAELLDAADAGIDWQITAATLLRLDVTQAGAEACWRSHIERARWIVGAGLSAALTAFGNSSDRNDRHR